jgi:hypothetical protein
MISRKLVSLKNVKKRRIRHEEKPHKKLFDSLLTFILYLYGVSNLPRTTARNIITKVWNLIIVVEYTQSKKETADENSKKILEEFLKNNCIVLYFKNI